MSAVFSKTLKDLHTLRCILKSCFLFGFVGGLRKMPGSLSMQNHTPLFLQHRPLAYVSYMILVLHPGAVCSLKHCFPFCPGDECHSGFQCLKPLGWSMELNRSPNIDFLNWFCGLRVITHLVETSRLANKLSGALCPDTFYHSKFLIITKSKCFAHWGLCCSKNLMSCC